jgi:tRNA-(ms[2]io[6]A)-hydroxylase
VLREPEVAAPGDEDRPPWHWSAIGAVGVFVLWVPLAMLVNGPLAVGTPAGIVALNAAAFAFAAFASGFLVGRFGGRAGRREAMLGGVAAGTAAWLVSASQGMQGPVTWALLFALIVALGGGAARAGGAFGVSRRNA